jgi:glycolate oxidase iron-sulfur subunit
MDTPRGRIVLMKEVLEGTLTLAEAQPHVDRCLGCLACEPACPSGVPYRDLISPFRALTQSRVERSLGEKITRFITAQTIPFPARFRIATAFGRIGKMFRPLVPARLRPMLDLVPAHVPPAESWPAVTPARGERRARVALLTGCAPRRGSRGARRAGLLRRPRLAHRRPPRRASFRPPQSRRFPR